MSRRSKRYERRQKERQEKQQKFDEFKNFENIITFKSLYKAANDSAKGVRWKESVQRYHLNLFSNLAKTRKQLIAGKDVRLGFIEFNICERGKLRHIKSVHFRERVVQKALCTNALSPVMTHNLITDNGASQKGKGTLFAANRLTEALRKYYRKYGNDGYILLIDFKSYFDNINHPKLKELVREYFADEKILKLSDDFIDAFGEKGLGLGSETSQINAVAYINKIDHYIKEVAKIKAYGRYMDDSYIIHPSKDYLKNLLKILETKYKEYGIELNKKETTICDLKHGFTFLKTRFSITSSGYILRKPCRDAITRERRKLKRQANLLTQNVLTLEDINKSYQSWCGSMLRRNAFKSVNSMKKLHNKLFSKGVKNG